MQPMTVGPAMPPVGDLVAGGDRPLLTYYDDATGERTTLTAAALGSWSARTAALLTDGCQLRPGDRAAVLLPPHWQTAAVLLGAWSAGITVSFRPWGTAGLPPVGADGEGPLEAVFVSRARLDSWLEEVPEAHHRFVLGLAPARPPAGAAERSPRSSGRNLEGHGAPSGDVPTGYRDYLAEVTQYPDEPPAYEAIRPTDAASPDGTSYEDWGFLAHSIAASHGLRRGERVLVDAAEHEQPVTWLLAPLTAGASVVLCANLDRDNLDARIAAEGVTRVL